MRKLVYFMMVSLDGFIAGPEQNLDFVAIDEEIHRFANEQVRGQGLVLYGRRRRARPRRVATLPLLPHSWPRLWWRRSPPLARRRPNLRW